MATCTYTVPDKNASGDNYYGQFICWQPYVDYFWDTYGFSGNKNYWDDGFGWEDCCNTDKPLARTFNACYLLTYSAEDYLNDSYSSSCLNWGRRYVRENIDDLISKCGDGSAIAMSISGCGVADRVELYLGFWYTKNVPGRAETLMHEARHQGGKPHNANFPAGSIYGAGNSGADSSWGYGGAGCGARSICGGSTPPAPARRQPSGSWHGSGETSSSTTASPRIRATASEIGGAASFS
jgi:hypothetical protein